VRKYKNILLTVILCVVTYYGVYYGTKYYLAVRADRAIPPQAYLHHYIHKEPYIGGPPEFKEDVKKALATIQKVSPEQYEDVVRYCVRVKLIDLQTKNAGMAKHKTIYVFKRGYTESSCNQYSLENMLVHETTHLIQYAQQKGNEPIEQREAEALAAERKLLTALEVPPEEIERIAGDHLLKTRWWEDDKDIWNAMGRN
jgi:hypothetical protein